MDSFGNELDDEGRPVPLARMNTYDVAPPPPDSGTSTLFQLIMNFINTVVGAGIVGLPFVFKLCGFYLGLIELGIICVITTCVNYESFTVVFVYFCALLLLTHSLLCAGLLVPCVGTLSRFRLQLAASVRRERTKTSVNG